MKTEEIKMRDPYIYAENGKYYLYGTSEVYGNYFKVYTGNDLENWDDGKVIFSATEKFWGTTEFWAPELHKHKGKYYLFATAKNEEGLMGTHILKGNAPDEIFEPISDGPITPPEWECLDGTLYIEDGVPYMVFCHQSTQIGVGDICYVRLSEDFTCAVSKPKRLFTAKSFKDITPIGENKDVYVTDGPELYKMNGMLYMFWSSFSDGYVQLLAYSDNGKIDGNWKNQDTIVYSNDGGHGMMFRTFDGKLKFILHTPNLFTTEHIKVFDIVFDENGIAKLL